jgi:hypothetical protein
MAEITVFTIPPVIRIFTVIVIDARIVWDGALLEEFFCLRKKCLIKIYFSRWGKCRAIPIIFVPDRIGAIWAKNRHNISTSFITFSLMEGPVWPKGS